MGLIVHCLWNASFEHTGAFSGNVFFAFLQYHYHDVGLLHIMVLFWALIMEV